MMGALVSLYRASPRENERTIRGGHDVSPVVRKTPSQEDRLNSIYTRMLRKHQLTVVDLSSTEKHGHAFAKTPSTVSPRVLTRMRTELLNLKTSLPLRMESAIFLQQSETRVNQLRAFITGPKDTPYAYGVFQFDILLTPNYPFTPPKVKFMTTGGGKVEFNPNLYPSGYVCLSLLGTWQGISGHGEKWSPTSTLLQVLVSLQSLVLVSEPYLNEPGNSSQTIKTKWAVKYKEQIQCLTIEHAMIRVLLDPPPGLEEALRKHFSLARNDILVNVDKWVEEANYEQSALSRLRQKLEMVLNATLLHVDVHQTLQ